MLLDILLSVVSPRGVGVVLACLHAISFRLLHVRFVVIPGRGVVFVRSQVVAIQGMIILFMPVLFMGLSSVPLVVVFDRLPGTNIGAQYWFLVVLKPWTRRIPSLVPKLGMVLIASRPAWCS